MAEPIDSVVVLGAGSWGTALAILLASAGKPVTLWARNASHVAAMQNERVNARYLPGQTLPDSLSITDDLNAAVASARDVLVAVPSHAFRATLAAIKDKISDRHRLSWATKGFETGSGKLLHQVLEEELGDAISSAVISGPTFAKEVAQGLPTAVTVASDNAEYADMLAMRLHAETFRAYTSSDVVGVEIGGSVKNVLAIAAGIADGLGFGANTRAALITRGLAETMRLGVSYNAHAETFMGLAGLGDLVLTCTDNQSRNRRLGLALGKGESLEQAFASIDQVVEGVQTAREVHQLAMQHNVDMPITEQVCLVVNGEQTPRDAVHALLERQQRPE